MGLPSFGWDFLIDAQPLAISGSLFLAVIIPLV
jgi:hypothetical protein